MELKDKTRRNVRVYLTDEEKQAKGMALAKASRDLVANEIHRTEVLSQIKTEKDRICTDIAVLSETISNGYIYRDVECGLLWHHPEPYVKTLVRHDTGESWTEPMTGEEINLFTEAEKKREAEKKEAEEAAAAAGETITDPDEIERTVEGAGAEEKAPDDGPEEDPGPEVFGPNEGGVQ